MEKHSRIVSSKTDTQIYGMVSKFEDTLLRCRKINGRFQDRLFHYLDDGSTLRRLRRASRVMHDLVDHHPGRLWRQLYVRAPFPDNRDTTSLKAVAPCCYSLTIKVGSFSAAYEQPERSSFENSRRRQSNGSPRRSRDLMQSLWERRRGVPRKNRSSSMPGVQPSLESLMLTDRPARASIPFAQLPSSERTQQEESRELWTTLLSHFKQLHSLTLRVDGDPVWPGRTEVEDMLVTLRVSLEQANLQNLRSVYLAPIHAMGIIHLRWLGVGAFSQAQAFGGKVWMGIETLDLRIHSPFASGVLKETQQIMFKRILYDYLSGFAPSLRCLRFVWLGGEGPSPLALYDEPGLEEKAPIKFPKLEELWVGNITLPNRTMMLMRDLTQRGTRLKLLRSTRRDSLLEGTDSSAWLEVLSTPLESPGRAFPIRSSSIYSQRTFSNGSAWAGGISRSSRDLMIELDL